MNPPEAHDLRPGGLHGVLLLDKPEGVSSSRVLAPIRGLLARLGRSAGGRKIRVGHAGTLDPFATGALLVLIGDATRLSRIALALPKTYLATLRFGRQTDTLDTEGEVVAEADPGPWQPRRLLAALDTFKGVIDQVPPAFAAVKVGGRRAYTLARRGEMLELEPRSVRIDHLSVASARWPSVDLRVRCGSGTYIRALARDLGAELGLPAYLTALRRLAIGPFDVSAGLRPLERDGKLRIEQAHLLRHLSPPSSLTLAAGLPSLLLRADQVLDLINGRPIAPPEGLELPPGADLVLQLPPPAGILGLAYLDEQGSLRPRVILAGAREAVYRSTPTDEASR